MTTENHWTLTPGQQMVSSCSGAIITSVLVTPLDVVKIRLQSQRKAFMSNKCYLYCNGLMDHLCPCPNGAEETAWYRRPSQFSGTIDAFIKITRTEGFRSLWSGLPPTLVMAVPSTVIYFTAYEQISYDLKKYFGISSYNMWVPLVSGSIARVGSAVAISPLELIRTKMQSKKLSYKEIGVAMRLLVQHNGYLSLWRGLGPTILRDVPFSAIYWLQYEYIKHIYNRKKPSFQFSFMAGAAAGAVAAVVTLPFDVVKTHRQIELGEKEIYTVDHPKKSAGTYQILKRLYAESGIRALFTGIVPRVIKISPACAIMIGTYEYGKSFFQQRNERQKQKILYSESFVN